jgi:hypothetical protein
VIERDLCTAENQITELIVNEKHMAHSNEINLPIEEEN